MEGQTNTVPTRYTYPKTPVPCLRKSRSRLNSIHNLPFLAKRSQSTNSYQLERISQSAQNAPKSATNIDLAFQLKLNSP